MEKTIKYSKKKSAEILAEYNAKYGKTSVGQASDRVLAEVYASDFIALENWTDYTDVKVENGIISFRVKRGGRFRCGR